MRVIGRERSLAKPDVALVPPPRQPLFAFLHLQLGELFEYHRSHSPLTTLTTHHPVTTPARSLRRASFWTSFTGWILTIGFATMHQCLQACHIRSQSSQFTIDLYDMYSFEVLPVKNIIPLYLFQSSSRLAKSESACRPSQTMSRILQMIRSSIDNLSRKDENLNGPHPGSAC